MSKVDYIKSREICRDLPWCQDDPDKLGPVLMNFAMEQEAFIRRWAQRWFENMQFIYGNQTVKWSRRYDFAVDVDFLRRETPLNSRAQTNMARVIQEALASLIYSDLPTWDVEASEESSHKGKRFRVICQKLLDAYMQKLCMDKELAIASNLYVCHGQVAARIDWDPRAGSKMRIPMWRKIRAPAYTTYMAPNEATGGLLETPIQALNSQDRPYFDERWEPVLDETGRQVIDTRFAGDVKVTMLSPFEYRREIGSHGMHKTRWVEHVRLMDYDQFIYEYKDVPGQTKHFEGIEPTQQDQAIYAFAVRHFMRMQFMTPPTLMDNFRRTENVLKGNLFKHKVMVVEHFDKPNQDLWENGRRVVVVNGKCTHITEPQYTTNKLDGWHPFVEAQWLTIAPSSIATGPLHDVISKNREINVMDSLYATALRRNLGSQLLVKTGSGFDPQKISGEPGQIHEVTDPDNAARWLHDTQPMPAMLEQLRARHKEDIYEVSGGGDALRGDRSKNVSSGYALRQLEEREQRRLTPARKEFEYFVSGIGEKIIACVRQNVIKLDEYTMGFMKRSASGEFQTQDVIAFLSSDIEYGIDIEVQAGSMAQKSKATMQATLQELSRGPLGQRLATDAGVLDNYLKYFDAETLRDRSASHRDRAQRENEIFIDMGRLGPDAEGLKIPIVLFEDDDDIHEDMHTDFLLKNADEIMSNENLLRSIVLHMEQHRIQKQEKQGQLPPGTTLNVPSMMATARQKPPPGVPVIYQQTQQKQAQQQQQQQQADAQVAQNGQPKAAKAPSQPAPPGSKGPPQIDVNAPSKNTPTGVSQGDTQ